MKGVLNISLFVFLLIANIDAIDAPPVKSLTLFAQEQKALLVKFTMPSADGLIYKGYSILVNGTMPPNSKKARVPPGEITITKTISNLEVFTPYEISVVLSYIINATGELIDSPSISKMFTTLPGEPSAPHIVSLKLEGKGIHVSWLVPETLNGEIESYDARAMSGESEISTCSPNEEELSCTLTKGIQYETFYYVSVRATNKKGPVGDGTSKGGGPGPYSSEVGIDSQVEQTPEMPINVHTSVNGKVITVRWSAPPDTRRPVGAYEAQAVEDGLSRSTCITTQEVMTCNLTDKIAYFRTYNVSVRAWFNDSETGAKTWGLYSLYATATIGAEVPKPVTTVKLTAPGQFSLVATIENPVPEALQLKGFHYTIDENNFRFQEPIESAQNTIITINNLAVYTNYTFSVEACYTEPNSEEPVCSTEKSAVFATLPGTPEAPNIVSTGVIGKTITVSWSAPAVTNGEIEEYEVVAKYGMEQSVTCTAPPEAMTCSLEKGIKYSETYKVSVRAKTKPGDTGEDRLAGGGFGPFSPEEVVQTGDEGIPRDVHASATGNIISVSWTAPNDTKKTIEKYEVIAVVGGTPVSSCYTSSSAELLCQLTNGIEYDTTYEVYVRAQFATSEFGGYSEGVIVTTEAITDAGPNVGLIAGLSVLGVILLAGAIVGAVFLAIYLKGDVYVKQFDDFELSFFSESFDNVGVPS